MLELSKRLSDDEIKEAAQVMYAESLSKVNDVVTVSEERLYGVEVKGIYLLLDDDFSSSEVIVDPDIYALPNSPIYFLGLCYIRSQLVPVYDLITLITSKGHSHYVDGSDSLKRDFSLVKGNRNQRYLLLMGPPDNHVAFLLPVLPTVHTLKYGSFSDFLGDEVNEYLPLHQFSGLLLDSIKSYNASIDTCYLKLSWLDLSRNIMKN